jgi:hypothetical protein
MRQKSIYAKKKIIVSWVLSFILINFSNPIIAKETSSKPTAETCYQIQSHYMNAVDEYEQTAKIILELTQPYGNETSKLSQKNPKQDKEKIDKGGKSRKAVTLFQNALSTAASAGPLHNPLMTSYVAVIKEAKEIQKYVPDLYQEISGTKPKGGLESLKSQITSTSHNVKKWKRPNSHNPKNQSCSLCHNTDLGLNLIQPDTPCSQ